MKLNKDSNPASLARVKARPANWEALFSQPTREEYSKFISDLFVNNKIDGDVVECGVGQGKSLKCFADYLPSTVKITGFDSFIGLPEVDKIDKHSSRIQKGHLSYDYEATQELFRQHDNVQLVRGFFDSTLSQYDGAKIGLLHLDCDIYSSYKTCLSQLYDKVVSGGIIMFDEYYREFWQYGKYAGAPVAIDEFLEGKNQEMKYYPSLGGKAYLIKH